MIDSSNIYYKQVQLLLGVLPHVSKEECFALKGGTVNQNKSRVDKPRHKEFLLGFKSGTPNWSLLPFEGIENLPSVQWKMVNLDKMDDMKRKSAVDKLKMLFEK